MLKLAQVLQLRGKLELLTKQTEVTGGEADIDAGKKADVDINLTIYIILIFYAGKEALLVYQDDSSDEMEDVMNDLLVPASDTDDDFDEEDGDETMEVNQTENWPPVALHFQKSLSLFSQASKLDSDSDVEIVNGDEEMESEEDD